MEIIEMIKDYIRPELLILVPVLYLIGKGIKKLKTFDCYIPLFLSGISIVLCVLYLFATTPTATNKDIVLLLFTALTQGILLAGASVYFNQVKKQITKINKQ